MTQTENKNKYFDFRDILLVNYPLNEEVRFVSYGFETTGRGDNSLYCFTHIE